MIAGGWRRLAEDVHSAGAGQEMTTEKNDARPSAWPALLASVAFSVASHAMARLYAMVHWKIMFNNGVRREGEKVEAVYAVLSELGWLQLAFAGLAVIWAAWSFKGRPRLGAMIALILAVFTIMACLITT